MQANVAIPKERKPVPTNLEACKCEVQTRSMTNHSVLICYASLKKAL